MDNTNIDSINHPLYKSFEELYISSFPVFEQRTKAQQETAFNNGKYHLTGFQEDGAFIGFISYWEFDHYIYIEHFAINTGIRGKGYGSILLDTFINSTSKIVLLEIDPVTDDISRARLRFYKRCGLHENPYPHKHPVYRKEYQPHPLVVLTSGRPISEDEYLQFSNDLNTVVMNNGDI